MGIDLTSLVRASPFLYHVTYEASLGRIRRLKRLDSAANLMEAGNKLEWLRMRRDDKLTFEVDGDLITLTDQRPLIEKNIEFQEGWTLADLVEALNRRVFCWRGPLEGLLSANRGHFLKYDNPSNQMIFLRMSFEETNLLNSNRGCELCKFNSGAARQNQGMRIPRGPKTFAQPSDADFRIGQVLEVVYGGHVDLPSSTEICVSSWQGPWQPLFHSGEK